MNYQVPKWRKEFHSPNFAGAASASFRRLSNHHPVLIIRDVIVRPREQSGADHPCPPSLLSSSLLSHAPRALLSQDLEPDRQTDRDGCGDGGMALPRNGKSPMQKWEHKDGSKRFM